MGSRVRSAHEGPAAVSTQEGVRMNAQVQTNEAPISLGNWILTLIVLAIPLVNVIMLFVWGFSAGTPISKRIFCRAELSLLAIVVVLAILVAVLGGAAAFHAARGMGGGPTL
jgi:hypothetical protein